MMWPVVLCAYKNEETPLGHAFVAVTVNTRLVGTTGLSPSPEYLPQGGKDSVRLLLPTPGMVYNEEDSRGMPGLKKKAWGVEEEKALKVLAKINADRRKFSNVEGAEDDSELPAGALREKRE